MGSLRRNATGAPRRGGALVAALMVVMLIAVLSAGMVQMTTAMTRRQVGSVDQKRAFYLAEAGLSESCLGLSLGHSGNVGTSSLPAAFGDGLFWVVATDEGEGRTSLRSTAMVGTGRCSLTVVVEREESPLGSLGFFGEDGVEVGPGVMIDGYDSGEGVYTPWLIETVEEVVDGVGGLLGGGGGDGDGGSGEPSGQARVGSNGDVHVAGGAAVYGTATPGPTGTVTIDSGGQVTGSTVPAETGVVLPQVQVPSLPSRGSISHSRTTPLVVPSGDGSYSVIKVNRGATVVLRGPLNLVAGSVVVDAGGKLEIDTSTGPVRVYVTDALTMATGSVLASTNQDPRGAVVYVTGSGTTDLNGDGQPDPAVVMGATGSFYGTLYAPGTPLAISSALKVFGSVVAKSLTLGELAELHYDESLADSDEPMGLPEMISWRISELPDEAPTNLRVDPRLLLGLDPSVELPKPGDAHDELLWAIKFVATDGLTKAWVGRDDEFRWGQVQAVIASAYQGEPGFDLIRRASSSDTSGTGSGTGSLADLLKKFLSGLGG